MNRLLGTAALALAFTGVVSCRKPLTAPVPNYNVKQTIVLYKDIQQASDTTRTRRISRREQNTVLNRINTALSRGRGRTISPRDTIRIVKYCPCDSNLVILEGSELIDTEIREGGLIAQGTEPRSGVSGSTGGISFQADSGQAGRGQLIVPQVIGTGTRNFFTRLPPVTGPDGGRYKRYKRSRDLLTVTPTNPETPFVIGIIDTGLHTKGLKNQSLGGRVWQNQIERAGVAGKDDDNNGLIDDFVGWNFTDESNNPVDDVSHGSIVTALIDEQVRAKPEAAQNVRYMILKTHDKDGKSSLFDNLCAMSYARKNGAKIINASWGFYAPEGSPVLSYFLRELRTAGVLFVTAAGNRSDEEDNISMGQGVQQADLRNLAKNPFYPACSPDERDQPLSNVFTVTTVSNLNSTQTKPGGGPGSLAVCGEQNSATSFADAGVANEGLTCTIPSLLLGSSSTITGSSFATPVVTGKLAAYLWNNWSVGDEQFILNKIKTIDPGLITASPQLNPFIRGGQYVKRNEAGTGL